MKRAIRFLAALAVVAAFFGAGERPLTAEVKPNPPAGQAQGVKDTTNIHYTGRYCGLCHEGTPAPGGPKKLKYGGDLNRLCRCHTRSGRDAIHPVGVRPSGRKSARIPGDFPLAQGKLSCLTCHDIYAQCRSSAVRKVSLRGGPYPRRTDFCFKCHDKRNYRKLDVHNQLNARRKIVAEKCLYCHVKKPDVKTATFTDLKYITDIETLCRRCHLVRGNHSGNFNHMIKPSAKSLARMKQMEKKFGIILPLDSNGKMTCITCHNPHDKGVIPASRPSARGAGSKFRHRLPGRLCIECHQM